MSTHAQFQPVVVTRRTGETVFSLEARARSADQHDRDLPGLDLANRLLSHLIDHWAKASGIHLEITGQAWPGSWPFDHVLCEDFGQLIGAAVKAIHDQRARERGVAGRARCATCMDDAATAVTLSFESRPRVTWHLPRRADIDGFVDAWYDADGRQAGAAYGTNLRQFVDGFAYGSGATVDIQVTAAGNLHHLYEVVFRALGDAVGVALGTGHTGAGDTSGLAGAPDYAVRAP
jgi:imidazoleglycerol phosphate dehydratase HisB